MQLPEVEQVLRAAAAELKAPYHSLKDVSWQPLRWDLEGGELIFPALGAAPFKIQLIGRHQLANAATALLALKVLQDGGLKLDLQLVHRGMAECRWPGRLEVVSREPLAILDGAHNREGFLALAHTLRSLTEERFTFVLGLSANREVEIIDPLLPLARQVFAVESQNSRNGVIPAAELTEYVRSRESWRNAPNWRRFQRF